MQNNIQTRYTSESIRYAIPLPNGKWRAEKSTHRGCTDFVMVYEDLFKGLQPVEYWSAESALHARQNKTNRWYH